MMSRSDLAKLFEEKSRVAKLSQIREIVFGTEDGLLVPLGVVSGVAGATTNNFYVLIAGLAEAFAGSISMGGAGAYLSSKAEREVQEWAIRKEMNEVETIPDEEKREIAVLFERRSLTGRQFQGSRPDHHFKEALDQNDDRERTWPIQ
jgi:VIT1/CCC1 family predicted Fe2+/Mn2+ transporter